MGARHKLNHAYFNGALIFAVIVGVILQSWLAFFVTLGLSLAIACHDGGIRLTPRR